MHHTPDQPYHLECVDKLQLKFSKFIDDLQKESDRTGIEFTYPEIVTALLAVMNTRVFNQSGVDLNMLTSETIRQRKLILSQRRQLK